MGGDLVQAGYVLQSLLPTLLHRPDALRWPLVRAHQWPAQGRGDATFLVISVMNTVRVAA